MDVGCTHIQDTYNCSRSLQKRTYQYQWCTCKGSSNVIQVRKPPVTYSFKVLQTIEKRVGAKLVPEMMENITAPEQYELLEMSKISGFINRAKGTGRPTKKERREIDALMDGIYLEDD